MAENPLTKLALPAQLGVAAVIAALICGGFYYFWYSDALEKQKTQEARLADLQTQIRALEATANKLPEFQREVQALEARLETLKRILPPEKEMPDLMRRLQYLAAQSSLQIRKFNPAAPVQKEFYQEVPVNLDLEGTYHNLGAFLDRVSRMSRLVNVGDIKIKAEAKPTINDTIQASASVPRRAVEAPDPQVQPGRPRAQGLLPGGPRQHRRRGHLPQHGRLP
jgi:type IV pilus assembly protein PilO